MYPYIDRYMELAQIYLVIRSAFKKQLLISKDFQNKTSALVREHVKSNIPNTGLEVYEINENTLQKIKDSETPDVIKVINLGKSIKNLVKGKIDKEKYLISILERVEEVRKLFETKQIGTQEALKRLEKLLEEINEANKKKIEKGFDDNTFFIYSLLNESFGNYAMDIDAKAKEIQGEFEAHPNWQVNSAEKRDLKASIYKTFTSGDANILRESPHSMDDIVHFVEKLFEVLESI
jgi:type I restriction enzyme R subunit